MLPSIAGWKARVPGETRGNQQASKKAKLSSYQRIRVIIF